jgi:hypothetical protein
VKNVIGKYCFSLHYSSRGSLKSASKFESRDKHNCKTCGLRTNKKYESRFISLLHNVVTVYIDLQYHSNIRWLSLGKFLNRMWDLRELIIILSVLKDKNLIFQLFKVKNYKRDLAFLFDVLEPLFNLNVFLVPELYTAVQSFETKCFVLITSLGK